ncbi:MAG: hypothetical protein NVSMB63_20080 [Sediminibacterium sp.]
MLKKCLMPECFTIVNDQATPNIPANTLNIAIDNVRIVKGQ